jgi:DNA-binding CsgD family transcriptional regulator
MIHLAVFGYVFVVFVGIACLALAVFLYMKVRNKLLFNFLIYYSALTLFVFSYLVILTYINANISQVSFYVLLIVLGVISLSFSFLLFSILHFGHVLVYEKLSTRIIISEILVGVAALIGMISSFRINWHEEQIYQLKNFGLVFSILIFFSVIGYSLILKLSHIKTINVERKQLLKNTSIINIIFIPGFAVDFYLLQTGYYSIFIPSFYFFSSILFIHYFIKKHNADITKIRSISDPKAYNDYLTRVGISTREKEIVVLIMQGYSNRKIANQLFISLSTVKTHIRNIFKKLNIESRFEIITKLKNTQLN